MCYGSILHRRYFKTVGVLKRNNCSYLTNLKPTPEEWVLGKATELLGSLFVPMG